MGAYHGWLHEVNAAEPSREGFLEEREGELDVAEVAVDVAPASAATVVYHSQTQYLKFAGRKWFYSNNGSVLGCVITRLDLWDEIKLITLKRPRTYHVCNFFSTHPTPHCLHIHVTSLTKLTYCICFWWYWYLLPPPCADTICTCPFLHNTPEPACRGT